MGGGGVHFHPAGISLFAPNMAASAIDGLGHSTQGGPDGDAQGFVWCEGKRCFRFAGRMAPADPALFLRMYHDWKGIEIKANAEFVVPGRDMADRAAMAYLLARPVQEHDL